MKLEFKKFSRRKKSNRLGAITVLAAFLLNSVIGPGTPAFAQGALPLPGTMVKLTPGFAPVLIKGLRVYPENPLRFDFIVDPGDSGLQGEEFVAEAKKAMKYFLSSLTVPEKDLWVNLSPFEKDRIIPDKFGKTEMGRDMLGQDYILKQLSASLTYPETELGKKYWEQVNKSLVPGSSSLENVNQAPGTNHQEPSLNRVWIIPDKAVVYSKNNIAYVLESHLKVMMEEDYENKSLVPGSSSLENVSQAPGPKHQAPSLDIFRTLILPQIEKEVNEGENFAQLRQLYNSLILATWFKRNLKQSILSKVYVGQNKIDGVTFSDGTDKNKIYEGYLEAFKKGVYNIIKEDEDAATGETIPRKYFSGGIMATNLTTSGILTETGTAAASQVSEIQRSAAAAQLFAVQLDDPKAVSSAATSLPASNGRAPQFNLFRSRWNAGPLQYLQTGHFEINADSRRLVMPAPDIGMVRQVRSLIRQMSRNENYQDAIESLRPVIRLLLSRMPGASLAAGQSATLIARREDINRSLLQSGITQMEDQVKDAKNNADRLLARYKMHQAKLKKLEVQMNEGGLSPKDAEYYQLIKEIENSFFDAEKRYSEMQDQLMDTKSKPNVKSQLVELRNIDIQLQRSEFLEMAPIFLAGLLKSEDPEAGRRLARMTAELAEALPNSEWLTILQAAFGRVSAELTDLSGNKRDLHNMNGLQVHLVANTADAYIMRTDATGTISLEVDFFEFLNVFSEARRLVNRLDFYNVLALGERAGYIEEYARHEQPQGYAANNPYVVAEIFRMLSFLRNVIEPYYFGKSVDQPKKREKGEAILRELAMDGQYVPTTRQAAEFLRMREAAQGRPIDISALIYKILNEMFLRRDISIVVPPNGTPAESDAQFIAQIYSSIGSPWFQSPVAKPAQAPAVAGPTRVAAAESGNNSVRRNPSAAASRFVGEDGVSYDFRGLDEVFDERSQSEVVTSWSFRDRILNRLTRFQDRRSVVSQTRAVPKIWRRISGALAGLSAWAIRHMSRPAPAESPNLGAEITNLTPSDARAQHLPAVVTTQPGQTVSDIAQAAGQGQVSEALEIIAVNPGTTPDSDLGGQKIVTPNTNLLEYPVGERDSTVGRLLIKLFGKITLDNLKRFQTVNSGLELHTKLTPGSKVFVPFTDEQLARWKELNSPQPAAAASSGADINQVGGINLDPSGLVISETGEKFKFDVPIDPQVLQKLQQNPVKGFVPVILNIVPIGNLPQFLGISKAANTQSPA